jgi:hypothetical protein
VTVVTSSGLYVVVTPIVLPSGLVTLKASDYQPADVVMLTAAKLSENGGDAPRVGYDWSCQLTVYSEGDGVYTTLALREIHDPGPPVVYTDATAVCRLYNDLTGALALTLTDVVAAQGTSPGRITISIADTDAPPVGLWPFEIELTWGVSGAITVPITGFLEVLP